ncbi:hypothetical protein [Bacteroides fragilis]|uniref:hypothetical protein n=1 Tax=Bacteroides fragilis TaxID=817 RepID=UPI00189EF33E|nr:hypothetical protein [Bacteroides fragilis]
MAQSTESISLLELLVKTHYHTVTTAIGNQDFDKYICHGSGFIVQYKDTPFFVTADHVLHPNDYDCEIKIRTGIDNTVSIYNNVRPDTNSISTVCTPLGGFYYMEGLNLTKPEDLPDLIDVTVCIMKKINFEYPFLTDEKEFQDKDTGRGQCKFILTEANFAEPDANNNYFIYGKIRTQLKGVMLHRENTLKENLKYVYKSGDYFLLNTPDVISDISEWAGLSGSPVFDNQGSCIGVLCSVSPGSNSIWVMPLEKVKLLMDIAIMQENIQQQTKK